MGLSFLFMKSYEVFQGWGGDQHFNATWVLGFKLRTKEVERMTMLMWCHLWIPHVVSIPNCSKLFSLTMQCLKVRTLIKSHKFPFFFTNSLFYDTLHPLLNANNTIALNLWHKSSQNYSTYPWMGDVINECPHTAFYKVLKWATSLLFVRSGVALKNLKQRWKRFNRTKNQVIFGRSSKMDCHRELFECILTTPNWPVFRWPIRDELVSL